MKKIIFALSLLASFQIFAYSANLDPVIKIVDNCLATQGIAFCNGEASEILKTVGLNSRGEFVFYLKEIVKVNDSEKFIINLYRELKILIPIYENLDTCEEWSCKDLKNFFGDVSVRYVKVSPIDSAFYIELFKSQANGGGRYGILNVLSAKSDSATKLSEVDEMIKFAEFAKNYCRGLKDEFWIVNVGIDIIRKMTVTAIKLRPGHEGVYNITFDNSEVNKNLKIDNVVVMESNDRDSLVVNFVSSESRIIKVSFTQAGLLADTFFSNIDVYNNDNNQEVQSPYFRIQLNRETNTIQGVFGSARYGKSTFQGKLVKSNHSVFSQNNVEGLEMEQLVGRFKVKVGSYDMTLVIGKRSEDKSTYEGALVNDNALITFSKVTLDSAKGVVSLVDSKNERKLTLGVTDISQIPVFKGQFLNSTQAKILDVESK